MTKTEELRSQIAAAEAKLQQIGDAGTIANDRAICRISGSLLVRANANTDRQLARYTEQARVVAELQGRLDRVEHADREAARVRLTAEDVRGAKYARTSCGWHKVVRVSAKSVSVETGYSWVDRYSFDKILEVRS